MTKRSFSQFSDEDVKETSTNSAPAQSFSTEATKSPTEGSVPKDPPKHTDESYVLNRNYTATTRLNCQFFLWKLELGYSLHPSIILPSSSPQSASTSTDSLPLPEPRSASHLSAPHIADLATGTAIWPLDIARTFPTAQIDGFDISLQQSPPPEWLPKNVTVREWDIFSDLPPDLQGVYDIVHIRLLLLVVRNNDPRPALRNAMQMLKAGGWIQWDELDPFAAYTVSTQPSRNTEENEFQRKQELTAMSTLTWVLHLHSILQDVGFENVTREEIECDLSLAKYYQDMQFLVMEEEAANKGTVEDRKRVEKAIGEGVVESGWGRARATPKMVCLGRKPGG